MKVWKCLGVGDYCEGMAIVASETSDEAKILADGASTWITKIYYNDIVEIQELSTILSSPKVIAIHEHGE